MASKWRQRERRRGRSRAARQPRRRLLVVCEGERTEPDYINGFQRHFRNAAVKVQISKKRGDPKRIVEVANKLKTAAKAEAKRQRDPYLDFDEVWCVFDRDDHERFDEACTMGRNSELELAISNPCFELWLLLHFRDSPGAQRRDTLIRMLREYLPGYSKRLVFGDVATGVADATARARRLDADADSVSEPGRNPTTSFYLLTDSIARDS